MRNDKSGKSGKSTMNERMSCSGPSSADCVTKRRIELQSWHEKLRIHRRKNKSRLKKWESAESFDEKYFWQIFIQIYVIFYGSLFPSLSAVRPRRRSLEGKRRKSYTKKREKKRDLCAVIICFFHHSSCTWRGRHFGSCEQDKVAAAVARFLCGQGDFDWFYVNASWIKLQKNCSTFS